MKKIALLILGIGAIATLVSTAQAAAARRGASNQTSTPIITQGTVSSR